MKNIKNKKEKQKDCNIEITLHHDYLKIIDKRDSLIESIQVPIRTAKIIHDMWEASHSTEKDIEQYAIGTGSYNISNPSFNAHVYVRGMEHGNEFQWSSKIIKKL